MTSLRHARQSGHLLLMALFIIAMTMAASAILAGALGYRMWLIRQEARNLHLTSLTDAAVAHALAELSRDSTYRGTDGAVPFDDGTYAITVRSIAPLRVAIEVRATYAGGGRAARAEAKLWPTLEVESWEPVGFRP